MAAIPDNWSDVAPQLSQEWLVCTAWAAGGGDPDGCEIQILGGYRIYTFCTAFCGPRSDRVRVGYLEDAGQGRLRQTIRWIPPDTPVRIRRVGPRGANA